VVPHFTNLRSLSCIGSNFTEFALHQVSRLFPLECLHVTDSSIPPKTESLPMLRPRTFISSSSSDPDGVRQVGAHHWLELLDTDHLQVLRVPLTEETCSFFIADANSSQSPFPSLHTVDLDMDQETLPMLPMLLSRTPALRSLKLFPYYSDTTEHIGTLEATTACHVTYLEDFHGPHMLLPIILGQAMGSSLRRVFLESVKHAGDPLDSFMNSFKSCHPLSLKALTHIHISLHESMDFRSLAKLQDMFPVLQVFHLHASEDNRRSGLSMRVLSEIPCPI
jgi:hypothetical protein